MCHQKVLKPSLGKLTPFLFVKEAHFDKLGFSITTFVFEVKVTGEILYSWKRNRILHSFYCCSWESEQHLTGFTAWLKFKFVHLSFCESDDFLWPLISVLKFVQLETSFFIFQVQGFVHASWSEKEEMLVAPRFYWRTVHSNWTHTQMPYLLNQNLIQLVYVWSQCGKNPLHFQPSMKCWQQCRRR